LVDGDETWNLTAAPIYIFYNKCALLFVFTKNGVDGLERAVKQKGPFQEADHANINSEEPVARLIKRDSKAAAVSTLGDLKGSTSRGYWYGNCNGSQRLYYCAVGGEVRSLP
jgi:hypothetical protein